ncbi:Deoxyribodipyrimidine photo-lyase type II [Candidatus Sulfopaludibacter sp. SbA6]|nr:Deoxyribodipyrimidine photo-lyase type II [Candidatus Sulfopaludibacter sp. SbA6]
MVEQRVRKLNDSQVRPGGRYVLYWLRYNRRTEANYALQFAACLANRLELPLLVFEGLSSNGPYANRRRHTFVLEGAAETATRLGKLGIGYTFHLDQSPGETLQHAAAVVTDDYPELLSGPPPAFDVQAWAVDSSCVVPAGAIEKRAYAAYSIRPKIHKLLPQFLKPVEPVRVRRRFARQERPLPGIADLASCGIDHTVAPSTAFHGGRGQAERHLRRFLEDRLHRYSRDKNEPSAHATSDLSPYLHAGYISPLEVALAVRDYVREHKLMADEFLEELLVRRELAFNFARYAKRLDSLEELPEWARATLAKHRQDPRDPVYTREQFESAATCDDLWNATQKELLLRGKIHGYYRMYWGKKIVEWSAAPEEALATMIHLHDRYALDGQDPNTYANILWCFGLHDRPWPERPVFGTVRWMSRAGMERKTDVPAYLREIDYLERTGKELTT